MMVAIDRDACRYIGLVKCYPRRVGPHEEGHRVLQAAAHAEPEGSTPETIITFSATLPSSVSPSAIS